MNENVELVEVGNVEVVAVENVKEVNVDMEKVNAKNVDDENAIFITLASFRKGEKCLNRRKKP